jgi:ADP-L-glycero-D-manno-heptose 6-epimerase
MKILITGYKGFIGKNLVEHLKDHKLFFYEPGDTLPSVDGLDWVIHLGALTSTTETNVELVLENNYDFSRWLVNECLKHNVNFQYSSSASVYGQNKDFNENSPVNPQSPYAWSKYLFDRYIKHTAGSWPIKVQGFRYFNVYGPHEDHKGNQASPYHKFEKQAKDTGVIKLFEGSDKFFRDFVPVETVCKIHKHFLGIAWVDVISTIIGAIFVSYVFNLDIWYSLLILFLLGIILHRLFCVRTTVDKILFP